MTVPRYQPRLNGGVRYAASPRLVILVAGGTVARDLLLGCQRPIVGKPGEGIIVCSRAWTIHVGRIRPAGRRFRVVSCIDEQSCTMPGLGLKDCFPFAT